MPRKLAQDLAAAHRSAVAGQFERHVSKNWRELTGSNSGGRWGPPGSYSVLYLGRPHTSVTVEAYRHLVDPFAEFGMTGDMVAPRRLLTCEVSVTEILDLRGEAAQRRVGLAEADLISDVGSYSPCHAVGRGCPPARAPRRHRTGRDGPRRNPCAVRAAPPRKRATCARRGRGVGSTADRPAKTSTSSRR